MCSSGEQSRVALRELFRVMHLFSVFVCVRARVYLFCVWICACLVGYVVCTCTELPVARKLHVEGTRKWNNWFFGWRTEACEEMLNEMPSRKHVEGVLQCEAWERRMSTINCTEWRGPEACESFGVRGAGVWRGSLANEPGRWHRYVYVYM